MTDEAGFIASLRDLATSPAARGLLDDAAVLEFGGEALVLTHDTMVEGVHWLEGQDLADVAWKLVATNLSDLAAKGAAPLGVLLAYSLADDAANARFRAGLQEVVQAYDTALLGGDTVSAPNGPLHFGLTAIGRATCDPVPSRSGAAPGDLLYVTGVVGSAMLGFEAMRDGTDAESAAYRRPLPLLREGQVLAPLVSAMMDVSDGLLLDASRMARASGVSIAIRSHDTPVADPARRSECLRWGDDYQLLFTAPADLQLPIQAHLIGEVLPAGGASLLRLDGESLQDDGSLGYSHAGP
ncbi:thiamine-phosphate kinase [Altererythrobacter sp. SALINAS58]|uniref:thiamine-phosphate kinase n=1 Tax=Alteripontixanthobacter muriae TaxID=2705546 RepID=UPI00157741F0|nr:thiamine-phosphate kinase [Alteripontixanthobacter muriae]